MSNKLGIMQRLGARMLYGKRAAKLDAGTLANPGDWLLSTGNTSDTGINVTDTNSIKIAAVWASVNYLSKQIASLPFSLRKNEGDNSIVAIDHPLHNILHNEPNPEMTSYKYRETSMFHLSFWGNAYSQIIRDRLGRPKWLYPLLPWNMKMERKNGILIYKYNLDGVEHILLPRDILHIKWLSYQGNVGIAPLQAASEVFGSNLALMKHGNKWFANGARPSGVVETDAELNETDYKKVDGSIKTAYSGADNSGKVIFLDRGLKYRPISIPLDQSQFLESREFGVDEIARIFGIPPHKIASMKNATFSNIEQQAIEVVTDTIAPWVTNWEQEVNMKLLNPEEKGIYYSRMNMNGLLRGDINTRKEAYKVGLTFGYLSPNDVRRLEDLNPIPNGDVYLVQMNMTTLDRVGDKYTDAIKVAVEEVLNDIEKEKGNA